MSFPEEDAFSRLEARFVEIAGLLERLRRYRPLAGDESAVQRDASRLSGEIRAALRAEDAERAVALEPRVAAVVAAAEARLEAVRASPDYAALVTAIAASDHELVSSLVPALFADVVAARPPARLFQPVLGARGSDVLEPEVGLARIREVAGGGFRSTPGPGVGGDENVRPIRFFDGAEGLDVAVLLVVDGSDIGVPVFRAGLDEILVYGDGLPFPFRVALRLESPDDWLEARPGGYAAYRARWAAILGEAGLEVLEL